MRKALLWILTFLMIINISIAFTATNPWHPLQQISGDNGNNSVDTNLDGIIDNTNSCTGDSVCEATNILATGNLTLGNGIIRFNDTSNSYYYYNGSEWKSFGSEANFLSSAGTISAFYRTTCPQGWILADGTSGTPDLRGAFIRGMYGNQNGRDVVRGLGNYQTDTYASHSHALILGGGSSGPRTHIAVDTWDDGHNYIGSNGEATESSGSTETRPKNIALIYCMKTAEDVDLSNLIWGQSGNNIYILNNSKNVGIGTTTPGEELEVNGQINATTDICITGGKCLSQVATIGALNCYTASAAAVNAVTATCAAGYSMTGGGGQCTPLGVPIFYYQITSIPSGNGWYQACAPSTGSFTATAYARCCRTL